MTAAVQVATIAWNGGPLAIEYAWVGAAASTHPVVVFLHEGLGSLSMWKQFPHQFCEANGLRGLVFSRYGYGNSTARPAAEPTPTERLTSAVTEASVAQAFHMLPHPVMSSQARTLEDLVQDMLRPMLKGWLDENLPSMVERLVRAEIERVARGR